MQASIYSRDVAKAVLDGISQGLSVKKACESAGKPNHVTFFRWLAGNLEDQSEVEWLRNEYARAKEHNADYMAEEILEICDDVSNEITFDKDGNPVIDGFYVQRARVMIDTRKWLMGKLKPKKYGDKVDLTSSDGSMTPKTADADAIRNAVRDAIKSSHDAPDA